MGAPMVTVLTYLIAFAALGIAVHHWVTTREPDADERDPNVLSFKAHYPERASWRNGAPRKPAA